MKLVLFISIIFSSQISFGQNSDSLIWANQQKEKHHSDSIRDIERYNKYEQYIAKADSLFANQNWTEAVSNYKEALRYVPNDQYSNKQLHAANEAMASYKKYKDLIWLGDNEFKQNNFAKAYIAYDEAGKLKPNEFYPTMRRNSCDSLLTLQKDSTIISLYYSLQSKGDSCTNDRNYECAKKYYSAARNILPNLPYAVNKLAEINKLEKYFEFKRYVHLGDSCVKSGNYYRGIENYKSALILFPNDTIVESKINRTESNKNRISELKFDEAENLFSIGAISADSLLSILMLAHDIDPENLSIIYLMKGYEALNVSGLMECDCSMLALNANAFFSIPVDFVLTGFEERVDENGYKKCGYFFQDQLCFGIVTYPEHFFNDYLYPEFKTRIYLFGEFGQCTVKE